MAKYMDFVFHVINPGETAIVVFRGKNTFKIITTDEDAKIIKYKDGQKTLIVNGKEAMYFEKNEYPYMLPFEIE